MEVCVFSDEVSQDFDEALRLAKEAGADSVEIRGGLYGSDVTTLNDAGVDRVIHALHQHGLHVASIGSPVGKCHHDRPEEVQANLAHFGRMIELSRRLDCRLIRCFAFWNPRGMDALGRARLEEYINPVADLLEPLIHQAEASDTIFGLEFAPETLGGTASEAILLHDAFRGSPAFGVVWDLAAEQAAGEVPFPNGYSQIKDQIVHVHVKPNRDGLLAASKPPDIDYTEALRALYTDGYKGAVSIEHWGSPAAMLSGVKQLRKLVETIQ